MLKWQELWSPPLCVCCHTLWKHHRICHSSGSKLPSREWMSAWKCNVLVPLWGLSFTQWAGFFSSVITRFIPHFSLVLQGVFNTSLKQVRHCDGHTSVLPPMYPQSPSLAWTWTEHLHVTNAVTVWSIMALTRCTATWNPQGCPMTILEIITLYSTVAEGAQYSCSFTCGFKFKIVNLHLTCLTRFILEM